MTKPLSIYHHQRQSFKDHAYALSDQLASINVKYRLSGRAQVDLLAKACGFENHSELVIFAIGKTDHKTAPLALFNKTIGELLAYQICQINNNIEYEHARAAILLSAKKLYVDRLSYLNTWTKDDYDELPEFSPYSRSIVRVGNWHANQLSLTHIRSLAKIVDRQQLVHLKELKSIQPTLDFVKHTNFAVFKLTPETMRIAKNTEKVTILSLAFKKKLERQETITKSFATHSLAKQLAQINTFTESFRKQTAWMNSSFMKQFQRQQKLIEKITNPLKY